MHLYPSQGPPLPGPVQPAHRGVDNPPLPAGVSAGPRLPAVNRPFPSLGDKAASVRMCYGNSGARGPCCQGDTPEPQGKQPLGPASAEAARPLVGTDPLGPVTGNGPFHTPPVHQRTAAQPHPRHRIHFTSPLTNPESQPKSSPSVLQSPHPYCTRAALCAQRASAP